MSDINLNSNISVTRALREARAEYVDWGFPETMAAHDRARAFAGDIYVALGDLNAVELWAGDLEEACRWDDYQIADVMKQTIALAGGALRIVASVYPQIGVALRKAALRVADIEHNQEQGEH